MPIKQGTLEGATKGNPLLKTLLLDMLQWQKKLEDAIGFDPSGQQEFSSPPPPRVDSLSVKGLDGRFIVKIVPAKDIQGQVFYKYESSKTVPFEASTTRIIYGPTPDTTLDVTQPGETRYWRVSGSFSNSDFSSTVGSGPVNSGLLRTSSQSLASTPQMVTSVAPLLVQDGTNATILISASQFIVGGNANGQPNVINYNGGSILGLDYDTYFVYADDPNKLGGSVQYIATKNASDLTAFDGRIAFGSITLRADGGGQGGGNGAGSSDDGAQGVLIGTAIRKSTGTLAFVETLHAGDVLTGINVPVTLVRDPIVYNQIPCFNIQTSLGFTITLSGSTRVSQGFGGPIMCVDLNIGDEIVTYDQTNLQPIIDHITAVTFIGLSTIYELIVNKDGYYIANGVFVHDRY